MTIDENTNVAKLLDEYPGLLDIFEKVSPHFKKLQNKFLRETIARRVKISDAAKVGRVDLDHLIEALNVGINGGSLQSAPSKAVNSEIYSPDNYDKQFEDSDSQIQITLDVRGDIATNHDPLSKIMRAANNVEIGKILVVINIFEPVPLYEVLGRKGFVHKTGRLGEDFRVLFKRVSAGKEMNNYEQESGVSTNVPGGDEKVLEIDVRGLEPPEPMMRILNTLNSIHDNTILLVHHHREPIFLYHKLDERGFEAITNKIAGNHYKIVIRRKDVKQGG